MNKAKTILIAVFIFIGIVCVTAYLFLRPALYTQAGKILDEERPIARVKAEQEPLEKVVFLAESEIPKEEVFILPQEESDLNSDFNKEILILIEKLDSKNFKTAQSAADELALLGKDAVFLLIEALDDASVGLKGQVVFILGRIGDKEAVTALLKVLKDENAYIRRNVAEALGKIQDESVIPALVPSLFDHDGGVRQRTAWALGELNDSRAVEDLIGRLSDEKEERVKSAVVGAMGKLKDERTINVLLNELSAKSNYLYKNEIVVALGDIGDIGPLSGLEQYLKSLREYEPKEKIVIFQWKESIRIAEEAIGKIRGGYEY